MIAGSSIRTVLELAGIKNILAKQLGGNNILNNARVKNFFDSTKDFETAHECCKIKCGINNG